MNIEDLIISVAQPAAKLSRSTLSNWESDLIYSFLDQLSKSIGFTEKQAALAIKVLTKHQCSLSAAMKQDVGLFLKTPTYKYPFRKLNTVKRMTICPHAIYGRAIKVEFPFNAEYVTKFRSAKTLLLANEWNKDEKAWIFPLTETSVRFLSELSDHDSFECDDEFRMYVNQCDAIINNLDQHMPMLVIEDSILKFKNVSTFVPALSTNDILPALFEARRRGITVWSTEVDAAFDAANPHPIIREFLESDLATPLQFSSKRCPIDCIGDIVKHLSPCLFIIPGGDELTSLKISYDFLVSQGIAPQHMSVTFRLDTAVAADFNIFVKEHCLNSPITEHTKIVFVNGKIPKPVLKSNIKFNSIINLGFGGVHYSIRDFLGSHENVIYYSLI